MSKCIMIQGTMSGAGKSLLVTALCRIFREDGYLVAPFKSQNMALNSYITRDGLEMGRAQVAQAEAAGKEPDVRMNPILLKPTSDVGSQVIVNGRVRGTYRARDYFRMKTSLIPDILSAYESLASENDIIVIEGAGSPAEINLKSDDIVNMGLAKLVDAPVILVGDIDPGGVFAQLYGTIALLEEDERARIVGTVINKFRGDVEILRPGLKMLEDLTHVPCLGVVPYTDVDIDDEDSLSSRLGTDSHDKVIDIAVIRLPRISNFTDFAPLEEHPALGVRYVRRRQDLGSPDMIILPGTKSTMDDLRWLRESGLEAMIQKLVNAGTPLLGVCGGYQMLGMRLEDPEGVESGSDSFDDSTENRSVGNEPLADAGAVRSMKGIGLLPVVTTFVGEKCRTRVRGKVVGGPFDGAELDGYEIHMGRTELLSESDSGAAGNTSGVTGYEVHMGSLEQMSGKDGGMNGITSDVTGYEIHMGRTELLSEGDSGAAGNTNGSGGQSGGEGPFVFLDNGKADGYQRGSVFGTYLHGLFDTGELTDSLADYLLRRKGIDPGNFRAESRAEYRERQYRKLADSVRQSLDMEEIYRILGMRREREE